MMISSQTIVKRSVMIKDIRSTLIYKRPSLKFSLFHKQVRKIRLDQNKHLFYEINP